MFGCKSVMCLALVVMTSCLIFQSVDAVTYYCPSCTSCSATNYASATTTTCSNTNYCKITYNSDSTITAACASSCTNSTSFASLPYTFCYTPIAGSNNGSIQTSSLLVILLSLLVASFASF